MEEEKKEKRLPKVDVDHNGLGCLLMIGLVAAATVLGNALRDARADDRVVSVKGLCEREVKADKVICPFAYKEGATTCRRCIPR